MAIVLYSMSLPESLIALIAPSIRGWMLSEPGVAMNSATFPEGTSWTIRLPISTPDRKRSWPMYARRWLPGSSALYETTGMPAASAFSVGSLNAFWSVMAIAMPSALPVIAVFMALTISETLAVSEPVHWKSRLSSAQASSAPYWVGTKNGFVVTWLTNTKRYLGVFGKLPAPSPSAAASSLDLPQAASAATSAAPPPARAARREISRRERASGAPSRSVKGPPPLSVLPRPAALASGVA